MYTPIHNQEWEVVFKPNTYIRKLYIELTNLCNLTCIMCYRHSWHTSEGEMSSETFHKIILELPKLVNLQEIVLGGLGEAMSHSEFYAMLEELHRTVPKVDITLTTNGVLLSVEDIDRLYELGVKKIVVSVDGAEAVTQRIVRGEIAGYVNDKLESLGHSMKAKKILWWWETVWQRKNKDQLLPLIELAAKCQVDHVMISHLMPTSETMLHENLCLPEEAEENDKIFAKVRNLALRHRITVDFPKNSLNTERTCNFVEQKSLVISWQGNIASCYRFLHGCTELYMNRKKEVLPFYFGNIRNQSILDIWNKNDYMHFRYRVANNLYPSCPDCILINGCDNVTRADSDCDGGIPSCGDCLWARGFIQCP
ncbi:hypothetical protein BHU72_14420 [Desulfuribacillus stibiiarsenatis]|uniref:Radical SAM core domain-containing protein n=1 Tax=Desulfuribacillus stibiiarsenatis TaxID=1390249 RepID=A0A1E5L7X0_9FIRM|nr:radical SAM protein [Desulfuribacillus stibiiarsenatis]OEH86114.1 hypothetical protein BHU72_14420 [Desulfuribacillus stibiiarsenatis]